jgi:hypothetical protein
MLASCVFHSTLFFSRRQPFFYSASSNPLPAILSSRATRRQYTALSNSRQYLYRSRISFLGDRDATLCELKVFSICHPAGLYRNMGSMQADVLPTHLFFILFVALILIHGPPDRILTSSTP